MSIFNELTKNFKAPKPQAPLLLGGLGQGGEVDAFVAEFGKGWKRTPVEDVWFVWSNRRDLGFTIRPMGDTWEVAFYMETLEDFKRDFKDKGFDAEYTKVPSTDKYTGLCCIRLLAKQGE